MKVLKYGIFIFIFLELLVSCNSRSQKEQDADRRLNKAKMLIDSDKLNAAKIELDSIHSLYPSFVSKRKQAAVYQDTILKRECIRNIKFCNQMLPVKYAIADSVKHYFKFEKNEKYQDVGNYVYKSLVVESNASRTYLKAWVDENSDLYLASNYVGVPILHCGILVAADELFARTDTVNYRKSAFYAFEVDGVHWETLTLKNDECKNVFSFIALHTTKKLKVSLLSKKTQYAYYLNDQDKKALAATYTLWFVMHDIKQMNKEIKKSEAILNRIKNQSY